MPLGLGIFGPLPPLLEMPQVTWVTWEHIYSNMTCMPLAGTGSDYSQAYSCQDLETFQLIFNGETEHESSQPSGRLRPVTQNFLHLEFFNLFKSSTRISFLWWAPLQFVSYLEKGREPLSSTWAVLLCLLSLLIIIAAVYRVMHCMQNSYNSHKILQSITVIEMRRLAG